MVGLRTTKRVSLFSFSLKKRQRKSKIWDNRGKAAALQHHHLKQAFGTVIKILHGTLTSHYQSAWCKSLLHFHFWLPANKYPERQQVKFKYLGPCPPTRETDWLHGSWTCPVMAITGISGMELWMEDLFLFASIFLPSRSIEINEKF